MCILHHQRDRNDPTRRQDHPGESYDLAPTSSWPTRRLWARGSLLGASIARCVPAVRAARRRDRSVPMGAACRRSIGPDACKDSRLVVLRFVQVPAGSVRYWARGSGFVCSFGGPCRQRFRLSPPSRFPKRAGPVSTRPSTPPIPGVPFVPLVPLIQATLPRSCASAVGALEELIQTGLRSTARCCSRQRHRQAGSVHVNSLASRRVASLRRTAGLDPAPPTFGQTGSCRRCPPSPRPSCATPCAAGTAGTAGTHEPMVCDSSGSDVWRRRAAYAPGRTRAASRRLECAGRVYATIVRAGRPTRSRQPRLLP